MGLFNFFPYTSGHTLNLDWIIKTVKSLKAEVEEGIPATVKTEVADEVSKVAVKRSGDIMGGNLDMDEHKISNLGWATENGDAVNLEYVSTALPQKYQYRENIASGGSYSFELPPVTQHTNMIAVIRPSNPTWTTLWLICGHYSGYYVVLPLISNASVTVEGGDGNKIKVTNGTNYALEFTVQAVALN